MLAEQIRELDDRTAARLLSVIANSRVQEGGVETEISPDMAEALRAEFGVDAPPAAIVPGDLARDALLLLAWDPAYERVLMGLLTGPETKTFGVDPVTAAAVITGALVVLQTHVRIERDKKGKWSFLMEKKAASDGVLKAVVGKLGGIFKPGVETQG